MFRLNLFKVFWIGGILLFIYCLISFIMGEVSEAIRHPISYFQNLYVESQKEHTIFDFIGALLDQLIPES